MKKEKKSWQNDLRMRVWIIARRGTPTHLRRLAAVLKGLGAETDDAVNVSHSSILFTHPTMPAVFFAVCIGVPYDTGLRLYKKWHYEKKIPVPARRRTSALERAEWRKIVAERLMPL